MNLKLFMITGIIFLTGCQRVNELGERIGIIEPKSKTLLVEGSNYYNFPEISPGRQYKSESTFCYRVQTDILCYDKPRSGWEDRMVGYQEPVRHVQEIKLSQHPQEIRVESSSILSTAAPITPPGNINQQSLPPLQ